MRLPEFNSRWFQHLLFVLILVILAFLALTPTIKAGPLKGQIGDPTHQQLPTPTTIQSGETP